LLLFLGVVAVVVPSDGPSMVLVASSAGAPAGVHVARMLLLLVATTTCYMMRLQPLGRSISTLTWFPKTALLCTSKEMRPKSESCSYT
jgi:hypothetical protein